MQFALAFTRRSWTYLCVPPLSVFCLGAFIRWRETIWVLLVLGCIAFILAMHRAIARKRRLYLVVGALSATSSAALVWWPEALWQVLVWVTVVGISTLAATLIAIATALFFALGYFWWVSSFAERVGDLIRFVAFHVIAYLLPMTASLVVLWIFPEIVGLDHLGPALDRGVQAVLVVPLVALAAAYVVGLIVGWSRIEFPTLWDRLQLRK